MAKQKVMTPGAVGGSKFGNEEEFTFDDLLDSIIERNIENQKSNRRDEDFKSAFKSMVATPKEYTKWQDKGYRQDQAVADFIKGIPMPSKEYPEGQDPFWGYEDESIRGKERKSRDQLENEEYLEFWNSQRNPFTSEAMSESASTGATKAMLGAISPPSDQPIYKDTDLIDAGYGITQRDLDTQKQWWEENESGKSFRRTDADWNEYSRVDDLVEEAKRYIKANKT